MDRQLSRSKPMAAGSYDTNSISWQVRLALQQVNEWLEYQFAKVDFEPPPLPQWQWPAELAKGLFWLIVIGLGLWFSALIYRLLWTIWQRRSQAPTVALRSPAAPPAVPSGSWHEAERLAQAGRYREACRSLYLAALQRLHEQRQLPHSPSRTDGEYLQTLAAAAAPQRPYWLLIRTHERTEFGGALASAETYQRCRQAYQELQQ